MATLVDNPSAERSDLVVRTGAEAPPDVSVIVVNYNTRHLIDEMMAALAEASQGLHVQVVLVDNASRDDSVEHVIAHHPDIELIVSPSNLGFGRANNLALPRVRGRTVLLLNTDAFIRPGALKAALQCLEEHPRCGVVGVRLVGRDGELQPSCRYFPTPWNSFLVRTGLQRVFSATRLVDDMAWDHGQLRSCDWVPGCFYLVRRQVIEEVGLFDPRFFMYCEEVDHCRRVKAARWEVLFCPAGECVHIGGESARTDAAITATGRQIPALQIESELLYVRKHYGTPGLVAALALELATALILSLKALLKRRSAQVIAGYWSYLLRVWRSARATAWGAQPTR